MSVIYNFFFVNSTISEQPTSLYGESLRQQVEDRLKFYESGEQPKKNIDVMKEAMDLVAKETAELTVSSEKKKKKKKRKMNDESTENGNGLDTTMEELNITNGDGNGVAADENGEPKKKKKKKKNKDKLE